jgi:polyisoprenoid-binding protein YceI
VFDRRTIGAMTITSTTLPLKAGHWAVDQAHSSIDFAIRHLGISKVRGRFADFKATVVVGDSLESTSVEAIIDLASLDKGNTDRDAHVRTADFLHVDEHPTMTFRSHRIVADGDGHRIEGEATIGAITQPLTFTVELGGVQDHPMGGPRHAGFEATGEVRRKDYGIAPDMPAAVLGEVIKFQLDIQLLEPSD